MSLVHGPCRPGGLHAQFHAPAAGLWSGKPRCAARCRELVAEERCCAIPISANCRQPADASERIARMTAGQGFRKPRLAAVLASLPSSCPISLPDRTIFVLQVTAAMGTVAFAFAHHGSSAGAAALASVAAGLACPLARTQKQASPDSSGTVSAERTLPLLTLQTFRRAEPGRSGHPAEARPIISRVPRLEDLGQWFAWRRRNPARSTTSS